MLVDLSGLPICIAEVQSVCTVAEEALTHEDEAPELVFEGDSAEFLEDHGMELEDETKDPRGALIEELRRPRHSDAEPDLSESELAYIDTIADRFEIDRLKLMQVLLGPSANEAEEKVVHLSTRMVRT